MTYPVTPDLCLIFAASIAREIAGNEGVISPAMPVEFQPPSITRLTLLGDHGELSAMLARKRGDSDGDFLILVRAFSQLFPDFRISEEPASGQDAPDALWFRIVRSSGEELFLFLELRGQFASAEQQNIRWAILSCERFEANLIATPSTAERYRCHLRLESMGRQVALENGGSAGDGRMLLKAGTPRPLEAISDRELIVGSIAFSLSSLADLLGGVPLEVELPCSGQALVAGKRPATVNYRFNLLGEIEIVARDSHPPHT